MSWNYRVIKDKDQHNHEFFAIHEVYYKDGKPTSCTENPIKLIGDSIKDLKQDLKLIEEAFSKPVLEMSLFRGLTSE